MNQPEHKIQSAFFRAIAHHSWGAWIHAIPNGGQRHKAVAAKLKAEGARSGIWDVFVPIPSGGHHGMYIEFKAGRNKLTDTQRMFRVHAEANGYKCEVHRAAHTAYESTLEYLGGE